MRTSPLAATFDAIYRANRWRAGSGPGSTRAATQLLRRILPTLIGGIGARTVLDAGCGESGWMPDLPGYVGMDVSPIAVQRARAAHPKREYRVGDFTADPLPRTDVVICRDALQHLPPELGVRAIENFRRSATWLLAGFFDDGRAEAIEPGGYYEPDLRAEPFSLGRPWYVLEDGRWAQGEVYPGKYLGCWAIGG